MASLVSDGSCGSGKGAIAASEATDAETSASKGEPPPQPMPATLIERIAIVTAMPRVRSLTLGAMRSLYHAPLAPPRTSSEVTLSNRRAMVAQHEHTAWAA